MTTLLKKSIKVNRIITTSPDHARAIEDPIRAKILELLYGKSMSAEQISKKINKLGHKKALTTIRHHIDILKTTGLVELVKIQETGGSITKYYGTSTKLLGYKIPENFDSKYSYEIKSASKKLEDVLQSLSSTVYPKIQQGKMPKQDYSHYIMMEIVNRAMTSLIEKSSQRMTTKITRSKKQQQDNDSQQSPIKESKTHS